MITKKIVMTAVISCALFLNACMDVATVVQVKKNGTGTIIYTVLLTKAFQEMMTQMASMGQNTPAEGEEPKQTDFMDKMTNDDEMKKLAGGFGEGVAFESVKRIEGADDKKGYEAVFNFKNVEKLTMSEMPKKTDEVMGQKGKKSAGDKPIRFKLANKKETAILTILMPEQPADKKVKNAKTAKEEPAADPVQDEQMKKQIQQMFDGFRFALRVKVEGDVSKTNASYYDKETGLVTIVDIDFGKIIENEELLKKLQSIKKEDGGAVMKKKLKGIDSVKFETEKKVTVMFK